MSDHELRCGMLSCRHCGIGTDEDSTGCRFSGEPGELLQDEGIPQEMCPLIRKTGEGG